MDRMDLDELKYMMEEILINFLLQIFFSVGTIILFGFLIAFCNKKFYSNFGAKSRVVCYVTGFIGTPVHECSHALFCILFGHKIEEIKLFSVDSTDGVLGYVRHTYNSKNFYQRLGNFFIGIAPIIIISLLLALLSRLFLPEMFKEVLALAKENTFSEGINEAFNGLISIIEIFFSYIDSENFWIYLLCVSCFSLHMTLSKADVQAALSGILFLFLLLFVIDVFLAVTNSILLKALTNFILTASDFMIVFMSQALIISLMLVGISYILKKFIR